jgi:hypothetical protein
LSARLRLPRWRGGHLGSDAKAHDGLSSVKSILFKRE